MQHPNHNTTKLLVVSGWFFYLHPCSEYPGNEHTWNSGIISSGSNNYYRSQHQHNIKVFFDYDNIGDTETEMFSSTYLKCSRDWYATFFALSQSGLRRHPCRLYKAYFHSSSFSVRGVTHMSNSSVNYCMSQCPTVQMALRLISAQQGMQASFPFYADRTATCSMISYWHHHICLSVYLPVCKVVYSGAQSRCRGLKVVPLSS